MASEQSSQSHPPRAWPEAEEPPPTWAQDPLGTSSPRLPLPQDEPRADGSWQTSPGTTSPGNGWQQAAAPQGGNDGRQQAPGPQADASWQTSPGNGWQQASGSQVGNPSRLPGGGDGWQQASGPQGNGGWQQPSPGAPSPNDGRQQPFPGNGRQASSLENVWLPTTPAQGGNDTRQQAPGPQGGGQGRPQAPGSPPAEPWQTSAAPRENLGSWPPAQGAENGAWPPTPPVESTAWNAGPPASRDPLFSPFLGEPSSRSPHLLGEPPGRSSPCFLGEPPAEVPVAPFGGAPSGNGAPLGNGRSNGGTNDGNGAGPAPRRSYGVPDNPAMWALAAATAAATSSATPDVPVFPPRGPDVPPPGNSPHTQQTVRMQIPQAPPTQPGQPGQPGHHLSRDPSDPNRPFVTAGQISGPKTPPPERQQELWNTVFGENYQAMDEEEDLEGQGRPVWVFALAGSVVLALILALLWAFIAGPLASTEEEPSTSTAKPAATGKSAAKPKPVGRLPRFPGEASPVAGTLTDQGAGITLAKLSTPWRQDQRPTVPTVFGFSTRQYLPAGPDSTGKTQFAQVMSGPLSPRLKSKYTSPENLAPVINAVASAGRKKFFPEDNTARKTAQQTLTVNGLPGQLAAYEITSGEAKTTMVVAAVSTGADLPAIVYMSVPDSKKELLPDINTVFKSIKASTS